MKLDIGCSNKKLPGFVGLDILAREGVDIVHDLEVCPWPIESDSCDAINASHVLEHLKPWMLIGVMNECWRVLKIGMLLDVRTPYGAAFDFDPTHTIRFQESSFLYFDPATPYHSIYSPNPWEIVYSQRDESSLELRTVLMKKETKQ